MVTIALVFIVVVMSVPLGIVAQWWLFKEDDKIVDPEWELYQQRYD